MNLAKFSIKQRVLVDLLTVIAIIVGTVVTIQMQREDFPEVELDWVFARTIYPGASPQEVEKLVTIPIEDALKNIDGIDNYSSVSREGVSFIFIELDPDLSNRNKVINDITRDVDKVEIPEDAEDPDVEELSIMHPLIEISFTGEGIPEKELRGYVDNFEDILKNIKGVGSTDKVGWRDKEISIEVDPSNLEKYYISLAQVIRSIQNQHLNLPGGKLKSGTKELILRTVGELQTADEFKDIIIRTNSDGKYLRVKDVAQVQETFEEQERIYKTNGKISINITPKRKKSGDTIKIVDEIRKQAAIYKETLPKNVSIDFINDIAFYVKRRLNVLISNGVLGLGLLMLTLLVFLNIRIALVTAIGIPFAGLTAMLFMSFFGVSLNLVTMFGLILVVGMIVDDAIVVSENVYRYMEEGMSVKDATITGASEVAAPVTTTILTTTAAFLPLMFVSGIMGKFLRVFPMAVIFCLTASLFEALIILPAHLAEWSKPLKSKHPQGISQQPAIKTETKSLLVRIFFFPIKVFTSLKYYFSASDRKGSESRWFQKLLNTYKKILNYSIERRYRMCFFAFLVLIGAIIFSIKVMPFKLFPTIVEIFYVRMETEEGTSLEETNKAISIVEQGILKLSKDEMENVTTTVGFSGEIGGGPFDKHGSKYAQCVVYLTPENSRKRKADTIIAELRNTIKKEDLPSDVVNLEFEKLRDGPPVGKPVSVQIRGDDYKTLLEISEKIVNFLKTVDGVEDIKSDYELDKEEIQITINKKEAARLGLNVRQIASTIRYAFEGGVATTMRKGDEDIDVIVRLPEQYRNNIEVLKNLTIPNNMERLIKLNRVAYFNKYQGIQTLNHEEGKRTITVTANVDEDKITSVEANKKLIEKFKDASKEYPGYQIISGGEWEDTQESIESMFKAFAVAFMLIYMILATQFRSFIQPLIIMVSIPFGLIGVIFSLYFHGEPVSLMAMFGMIGLTGVVVNDSLILIDFVNKRREKGLDGRQSVQDAGQTRLRPILLTSITTIIALIPLIYGIGGEEPFVRPAAIAMAFGLLAATFLTLVIVPCVYLIVDDIRGYNSRRNNKKQNV
ncbi:MAG: efflux RND transporter permease subunit [Elusimicrobia bacterium]|nr:efflux RND transporter permease subunit [Elusimicrobiota bacterium]